MKLVRISKFIIEIDRNVVEPVHLRISSVDINEDEAREIFEKGDGVDLAVLEKLMLKNVEETDDSNLDRIVIGGTYRHFKGKLIKLLHVARHSENPGQQYAVYDCGDTGIYVRPLEMFLSEVDRNKYPDVKQKYRFELVEEINE